MVEKMQRTLQARRDKSSLAKYDFVDSEELQMMDECNRKWVDSWKKAVKQQPHKT
jgi:hypothetical protein